MIILIIIIITGLLSFICLLTVRTKITISSYSLSEHHFNSFFMKGANKTGGHRVEVRNESLKHLTDSEISRRLHMPYLLEQKQTLFSEPSKLKYL